MYSLHVDTARTWRGGQNQALLTVLGLRVLGHRTLLVCHPEGELRRRAMEGGDVLSIAPRHEMDFSAAWQLSRVIRHERPDVVHAHDPHGVAMTSVALSMSRLSPCPVFVASRRVDFRLRRNAFSRWKYRQVDAFLCASEAIRRMLIGDGIDARRLRTVHEGIDIEHVDAAQPADLRAEYWLPRDAPIVGNIAALVPHKGQRHLIEAARLVVQRIPDARFVIVGEGELRSALQQLVERHHLEKHILLTGLRPDPLSVLKGFDLFVMSSVTEGLGTSLLDAMACHRAIVATRAGGIPEVVVHEETGLLVPVRDEAALADGIVRLLGDSEMRDAFGRAGRIRVVQRFSADRMVSETLAAYEALVDRRHAADTVRPSAAG
jgi:glycosyltransferase involved in cell wall biosynthesis